MDTFSTWYAQLNKPSWTPPTQAFGIVWSILYPSIFASYIYIWVLFSQNKVNWILPAVFTLNLILNLVFTPIQFGLRNLALAAIIITGVLITCGLLVYLLWQQNQTALALILVPYLLWVSIATALQINIALAN
jgi:translocator protein